MSLDCSQKKRNVQRKIGCSSSPERAFNCTNIQCFEEVSKCFRMERSLVWSSRMESVSPTPFSSAIKFVIVKNNRLSLPIETSSSRNQSILIIEFISLTFPTWQMYSVNLSGNSTLSCNSGTISVSLECPGLLGNTGNVLKN